MRYSCAAVLALLLCAPAVPAFAEQIPEQSPYGQGGFQGPTAQGRVNTVAQARKAWDDTSVTLTGHIVQRMPFGDDDYLFRDSTGEIVVDIDHEVFMGRTVTPETKVRITGEVDNDFFERATIDVNYLEIL